MTRTTLLQMDDQDNAKGGILPYDVVIHILGWLRTDSVALRHSSVVNRAFRDAAAKYLYYEVIYSPPENRERVLDLKRRDDFLSAGKVQSAQLPHNAMHVQRLEIGGYPSSRPPGRLAAQIRSATDHWKNLHTVAFALEGALDSDLFAPTLPLLPHFASLRHLRLDPSCTKEAHVPHLAEIRGLESLTIEAPSRAVLQQLPEWLDHLSPTLRTFRLTHSCGSVTPGVLRSFIPHLQTAHTVGIGLSYTLTDDDVLAFLGALPNLRAFEYRYYLQFKPFTTPPPTNLRALTVHHEHMDTCEDAAYLCTWVRRVAGRCPLERLALVCDGACHAVVPAFDALFAHLAAKHGATLRALDVRCAAVTVPKLEEFLRRCAGLEELGLAMLRDQMIALPAHIAHLERLHTLRLRTRGGKGTRDASEIAEGLMEGNARLRRVSIDGQYFEREWEASEDGSMRSIAKAVQPVKTFPWEMGSAPRAPW